MNAGVFQADWVAMNYVPLAEGVLRLTVQLYRVTAAHASVVEKEVAFQLVHVSNMPTYKTSLLPVVHECTVPHVISVLP